MHERINYLKNLSHDLPAGLVVFLVSLPLCLGIAVACDAPPISGLLAGIVGGMLVAWLSGSQVSVSGPATGLIAIVATQVHALGSFETFLVAVVLAGAMQVVFAVLRAGIVAAFFPSSVIKGLMAAIGIILVLKQAPHLIGHDPDWLGDMSFDQLDGRNTFSELVEAALDSHPGAAVIGLLSLAILIVWNRTPLRRSPIPASLVVVVVGTLLALAFESLDPTWVVGPRHSVQVPDVESLGQLWSALPSPDWSRITARGVFSSALVIAVVASLESLLFLEAIDKLDPSKRVSPPNQELLAQGVGNIVAGLIGGLPIATVVVRSSVNIQAGGRTRIASFTGGTLLLGLVLLMPALLNLIPLSCLAAILMVTGFKLTAPNLLRKMWREGRDQFVPFVITVLAIVLTDLLAGIVIGTMAAVLVLLRNNLRNPLRRINEHHVSGDVLRIELANQVGFLNRASLRAALATVPDDGQVVLDARNTHYMDADILDLIRDFETEIAPSRNIQISWMGFQDHYDTEDKITYVDYTTRDIQQAATPDQVLQLLFAGNERFVTGRPIERDPRRQVDVTAPAQFPLACVLTCMDSRIATELVFDAGLGDFFSVRVAGNTAGERTLGSLEYGCAVSGAKLLLVLGHSRCGAIAATIDFVARGVTALDQTGCENLDAVVEPIVDCVHAEAAPGETPDRHNQDFMDRVTARNVHHTIVDIRRNSSILRDLETRGAIAIVGAVYDVSTGRVSTVSDTFFSPAPDPRADH